MRSENAKKGIRERELRGQICTIHLSYLYVHTRQRHAHRIFNYELNIPILPSIHLSPGVNFCLLYASSLLLSILLFPSSSVFPNAGRISILSRGLHVDAMGVVGRVRDKSGLSLDLKWLLAVLSSTLIWGMWSCAIL